MPFRSFFILFIFCLLIIESRSQDKPVQSDSASTDTTKRPIINTIKSITQGRVQQRLLKSITRKPQTNPTQGVRSESAFMPYEGKIIRNILIKHIGFDKTVYDTTRNIKNTITKISKALHSNSKDWLIRDHLFFREDKPLSPYKLADNERYLRDLDFILDAKFYVIPLRETSDSVDVIVLTRDVFSLGGSISPRSPTRTRFRIYDANVGGYGQRVQFNGLFDEERNPNFIYEAFYRKNSIGGTFIDGTIGYTQLNTGSSYGAEEEKAYFIRLDRPLVSPYTQVAGGLEISRNWSNNFFGVSDSLFLNYRYRVNDFWIGYNIGANSLSQSRGRHFVAVRVFDQHFTRQPFQLSERESVVYNNRTFVLGGITFFKQNFYTASYIFGFGRTEDVPYGRNLSFYVGWSRELNRRRPYFGMQFEKSIVTRSNEFYDIAVRAGGYRGNEGKLEDATVLVNGSLNSRLIAAGDWLIRQSFGFNYTQTLNQRTNVPLDINDEFGLRYFVADSLQGTKRFTLSTQSLFFTPYSLLGFRFAPFLYGEMASVAPKGASLIDKKPFVGFGGGIRTRNENLVFGTVELRMVYFPRVVESITPFTIRISSNLRVKYTASFVRAPDFIRYN